MHDVCRTIVAVLAATIFIENHNFLLYNLCIQMILAVAIMDDMEEKYKLKDIFEQGCL